MDLGAVLALFAIVGLVTYVVKDLIRNLLCGIVIKLHPKISEGDWIAVGRFGPRAKIKRFGVKYTYCELENGETVLQENEAIFNAPWISKGERMK